VPRVLLRFLTRLVAASNRRATTDRGQEYADIFDIRFWSAVEHEITAHDMLFVTDDASMPTVNCEGLERLKLVPVGGWRRADQGGIEDIDAWCKSAPHPVLVVIDTLERIRKPTMARPLFTAPTMKRSPACRKLRLTTALPSSCCIMIEKQTPTIHSTPSVARLVLPALPIQSLSSNVGRMASSYTRADAISMRARRPCNSTRRNAGGLLGAAAEVHRSAERARLIGALKLAGRPLRVGEIMIEAEMPNRNAVDVLLSKMVKDGGRKDRKI
jgi:hypothetical protein